MAPPRSNRGDATNVVKNYRQRKSYMTIYRRCQKENLARLTQRVKDHYQNPNSTAEDLERLLGELRIAHDKWVHLTGKQKRTTSIPPSQAMTIQVHTTNV